MNMLKDYTHIKEPKCKCRDCVDSTYRVVRWILLLYVQLKTTCNTQPKVVNKMKNRMYMIWPGLCGPIRPTTSAENRQ